MEKSQALKLLKCRDELNNNRLPKDLIDECYKLVPDTIPETFQRVKIQAIQRFVTFNMDIISQALQKLDMKTTVIVEQSSVGKKIGKTSTRPKTKKKTQKK